MWVPGHVEQNKLNRQTDARSTLLCVKIKDAITKTTSVSNLSKWRVPDRKECRRVETRNVWEVPSRKGHNTGSSVRYLPQPLDLILKSRSTSPFERPTAQQICLKHCFTSTVWMHCGSSTCAKEFYLQSDHLAVRLLACLFSCSLDSRGQKSLNSRRTCFKGSATLTRFSTALDHIAPLYPRICCNRKRLQYDWLVQLKPWHHPKIKLQECRINLSVFPCSLIWTLVDPQSIIIAERRKNLCKWAPQKLPGHALFVEILFVRPRVTVGTTKWSLALAGVVIVFVEFVSVPGTPSLPHCTAHIRANRTVRIAFLGKGVEMSREVLLSAYQCSCFARSPLKLWVQRSSNDRLVWFRWCKNKKDHHYFALKLILSKTSILCPFLQREGRKIAQ